MCTHCIQDKPLCFSNDTFKKMTPHPKFAHTPVCSSSQATNTINDPRCLHCHSYLYPLHSHEWSQVLTLPFISLSTAFSWMIPGINTAIHISIHCDLMNDPRCQHCHSYLYPLRSHEWSQVSTLPFISLSTAISWMIPGVNTAIHICIHCDLMNDPRCQHCHSYLYPLRSHEWSQVSTLPDKSLSTVISWTILGVNTAIHIYLRTAILPLQSSMVTTILRSAAELKIINTDLFNECAAVKKIAKYSFQ